MAFGIQTLKKFFGKLSETTEPVLKPKSDSNLTWSGIWDKSGSRLIFASETPFNDEKLFNKQSEEISNAILLQDASEPKFFKMKAYSSMPFHWLNKGELVAGSSLINRIDTPVQSNDVDIYFKSKEDAIEWMKLNDVPSNGVDGMISSSCIVTSHQRKLNLIWGIAYDSSERLLSGFDIRACAIGYDPNEDMLIYADGTLGDIQRRRIVYQTGVRNLSVHRLLKYLNKGFSIDNYQRVIFAELMKLGRHNSAIELATGEVYSTIKPVASGGY